MPGGDVSAVRCVPGGWRPLLRCVRRSFGWVPVVWSAGPAGRPVLPVVWACAGGGGARLSCGRRFIFCGPGGGAAGVLGAVLRRGRVHPAVGVAGPGGGAGTAVAVFRDGADGDRPVRGGGGEVHRGRGDGGVGDPGRRRGGRGAGGARRAGPGGFGRGAG